MGTYVGNTHTHRYRHIMLIYIYTHNIKHIYIYTDRFNTPRLDCSEKMDINLFIPSLENPSIINRFAVRSPLRRGGRRFERIWSLDDISSGRSGDNSSSSTCTVGRPSQFRFASRRPDRSGSRGRWIGGEAGWPSLWPSLWAGRGWQDWIL